MIKTQINVMTKKCKACVHFSNNKCLFVNRIKKPSSFDVIVDYEYVDAVDARNDPILCGPEAKYFKEK